MEYLFLPKIVKVKWKLFKLIENLHIDSNIMAKMWDLSLEIKWDLILHECMVLYLVESNAFERVRFKQLFNDVLSVPGEVRWHNEFPLLYLRK